MKLRHRVAAGTVSVLALVSTAACGTTAGQPASPPSQVAGTSGCLSGAAPKPGTPVVAVAIDTASADRSAALVQAERAAFSTVEAGTFGHSTDLVLFTFGARPENDTVQAEILAEGDGPNATYAEADSVCKEKALALRFDQLASSTTPGQADLLGAVRVLNDDLEALSPSHTSVVVMGPGVPNTPQLDLTSPAILASNPDQGASAAVGAGLLPKVAWAWYFAGVGSADSGDGLDALTSWWWSLAHQSGGSLHEIDPTGLAAFPAPTMAKPQSVGPMHLVVAQQGTDTTVTAPAALLFDFDSAALNPGASTSLEQALGVINQHPGGSATVTGYTDAIGSAGYNHALSVARAQAVIVWLEGNGVDPGRLIADGGGATNFVATNGTTEGRAQNRRVVISIAGTGAGS
jgi:outer membrane protein OmpA-like peptidoglycan-associated protein